jgi:TIR domain
MPLKQDLFISHATADKERYILPLTNALLNRGVTFWLDSFEIGWGDNFVIKINDGLRSSRFGLVCLSKSFLARRWPETEMAAVIAIQYANGNKKVLPLILNSKAKIIETYPILAGHS